MIYFELLIPFEDSENAAELFKTRHGNFSLNTPCCPECTPVRLRASRKNNSI